MRQIQIRGNYVKLWRLGNLEYGKQDRWSRAPMKRGMWAFIYPYLESGFIAHKYFDLLPKHLHDPETPPDDAPDNYWEDLWKAQNQWISTVGKKILPLREFWYAGDVYTHYKPNGEVGNTGLFDPEDTTWHRMDIKTVATLITKDRGDTCIQYSPSGEPQRFKYSHDHLEVFFGEGMGRIRSGNNPHR